MRAAIGLMAKAPIDGQVRTRLCPPLEPHEACAAAMSMLRDGADAQGAIGADPWCVHTLDTDYLAAAIAALVDHEVVLGPAVDGGYSLIGSSRPTPTLFAVTMSTDAVLEDTIARAAAGLRVRLLAERGDLDTLQDLVIAMDAGWLAHAPRTLRLVTDVLQRHGTAVGGAGRVGSDSC